MSEEQEEARKKFYDKNKSTIGALTFDENFDCAICLA